MQLPDAEALFNTLLTNMRGRITPDTALVGIHTGGAWLADRLHSTLHIKHPVGSIDVSYYRDDFGAKDKLPRLRRTELPFPVENAHIIVVDDVLYTGRTVRAALNELFDFGRPARVELAVLIDRGGRELPISPDYCAATLDQSLPQGQKLDLDRDDAGRFTLRLKHA